jgi:hypothetical protein
MIQNRGCAVEYNGSFPPTDFLAESASLGFNSWWDEKIKVFERTLVEFGNMRFFWFLVPNHQLVALLVLFQCCPYFSIAGLLQFPIDL